ELVELLVLAAAGVDLDQREAALAAQLRERLPELRRDAPHLAEARRVEAGAVPQHLADLVVLPRRHLLEVVEERRDVLHAVVRASEQPDRGVEVARLNQASRLLDLEARELEPELRRLVHGEEEELVAVHHLLGPLMEAEQRV